MLKAVGGRTGEGEEEGAWGETSVDNLPRRGRGDACRGARTHQLHDGSLPPTPQLSVRPPPPPPSWWPGARHSQTWFGPCQSFQKMHGSPVAMGGPIPSLLAQIFAPSGYL